jgi:hypothetical protein
METNRSSIGCLVGCEGWTVHGIHRYLAEWWLRLGSSGFSPHPDSFNLLKLFSTQFIAPYVLKRANYFGHEARDSFAEVSCCTNLV